MVYRPGNVYSHNYGTPPYTEGQYEAKNSKLKGKCSESILFFFNKLVRNVSNLRTRRMRITLRSAFCKEQYALNFRTTLQ